MTGCGVHVTSTDWHTAGEPFRLVTEGEPEIAGATVRDCRDHAIFRRPKTLPSPPQAIWPLEAGLRA